VTDSNISQSTARLLQVTLHFETGSKSEKPLRCESLANRFC